MRVYAKFKICLAACAYITGAAMPVAAQGIFGPGKFHIEQSDDRFSTSGLSTRTGINNRVTRKTAGGAIYMDYMGLYLEPFTIRKRDTGELTSTGFLLQHITAETGVGVVNTIGAPLKISFLLPGGKLIEIDVKNGQHRIGRTGNYDRFTRSAETDITESGVVELTPADMSELAKASEVTINVRGEERSWTIEAKDVAKSFLPNISAFYTQEIAPETRRPS